MMQEKRVVLITGASSGLGQACAERLARGGDRVYGTSRAPQKSTPLAGVEMLAMNLDDDRSVGGAVERMLRAEGRLDVVINNGGFGFGGPVEETSLEEAKAIFETNLFGVLRVCRAVLPTMRQRRSGTIVNVSSLGGRIGLPFQGLYSATKFALEGMSEALRMEAKPFGVRVVLVEPGDFRTGFTQNRRTVDGFDAVASPYKERSLRAIRIAETDERNGSPPEAVARLVERVLNRPHPRVRYPVGARSQRAAAALKGILPSRLFEWGLMKYYKVN